MRKRVECRDGYVDGNRHVTVRLAPAVLTMALIGCLNGRVSLGDNDAERDAGTSTFVGQATTTPPPKASANNTSPAAPTPPPTTPADPVANPPYDAGIGDASLLPESAFVEQDVSAPETGPSDTRDASYQDANEAGVALDEVSSRFCLGFSEGVTWGSVSAELVKRISAVAYSPDGKRLALGISTNPPSHPNALVVPADYEDLVDIETRSDTLKLQGNTDTVRTIEFSPDGQFIAIAGQKRGGEGAESTLDGVCQVFRVSDGTIAYALPAPAGHLAASCRFSPTGQELLMSSYAPNPNQQSWSIRVVQASDGTELRTIDPKSLLNDQPFAGSAEVDADFSPNGANVLAYSWCGAGSVRVADGARLMTLPDWNIVRARYSPDGSQIASIDSYGTFKIWNAADGSMVQTFASDTPTRHQVQGLYWVDSDHILLVADTVRIWRRASSGAFALACAPRDRLDDLVLSREPEVASQGALSPNGRQLTVPLVWRGVNGYDVGGLWIHPSSSH